MSNSFVSLVAPAANGSGAAVDVSGLGGSKSIVVQGLAGAFVQVEYSNDPAHLVWAPALPQFTKNGIQNISIACHWMRATVLNYDGGGAPVVAVGASDVTATFAELVSPAGNGQGAAVDVSALPGFKTIQISGMFSGAFNIEASENAGTSYATVASFSPGSVQQSWTGIVYADRMRINRSGCGTTPGLPVCYIGATELEGSSGGTFVSTDGGESGLLGAGTLLDPWVPVAGPFRPITDVYVFDDYLVAFPPWYPSRAGEPTGNTGIGNTSIMENDDGVSTYWGVNTQGALGPGVGSMMGHLTLELAGADAGKFVSATQYRDGGDSGLCIDLAKLTGTAWDLFYAARVSFESANGFIAQYEAFAGFREQIDLSVIGVKEGAWFYPKDNGLQTNWFAFYRIIDDTGVVTADIDTGVRVGFTTDHPADPKAAQDLLVRFQKHAPLGGGENVSVTMAIDGVTVQTGEFTNPITRMTPMEGLVSKDVGQFQDMYIDWALWSLKGRTR